MQTATNTYKVQPLSVVAKRPNSIRQIQSEQQPETQSFKPVSLANQLGKAACIFGLIAVSTAVINVL